MADVGFIGVLEDDHGRALSSPGSAGRLKRFRCDPHYSLLLNRRELCHAAHTFGSDRRKDLAADAKIRMVHMRALFGFRKAQSKRSEFIDGHYFYRCRQ